MATVTCALCRLTVWWYSLQSYLANLALHSDINAGGSVRCGIRDYSARRCPFLTGRSMINQLYLWDEPAKYLYLYFPSPLYLCLVADIFVKGRKAPAVFIICRLPVNNSGTNPGVNQHWVGKLFRIKERESMSEHSNFTCMVAINRVVTHWPWYWVLGW